MCDAKNLLVLRNDDDENQKIITRRADERPGLTLVACSTSAKPLFSFTRNLHLHLDIVHRLITTTCARLHTADSLCSCCRPLITCYSFRSVALLELDLASIR